MREEGVGRPSLRGSARSASTDWIKNVIKVASLLMTGAAEDDV